MILPVFVANWELDCCQPEARIGEEWTGCLFLDPPTPWWVQDQNEGTSSEPGFGAIEVDVDVLRMATTDEAMALVDAGPARLGVKGLRGTGRHRLRGRISSWWHGPDPEGVQLQEVACRGVVRRVRLVPVEFERRGERSWFPVAELAPIDVRSTDERRRTYMDTDADRHHEDELLIDLEVLSIGRWTGGPEESS